MSLLKVYELNLYLRSYIKCHLLKDILAAGCYQAYNKRILFMKKHQLPAHEVTEWKILAMVYELMHHGPQM